MQQYLNKFIQKLIGFPNTSIKRENILNNINIFRELLPNTEYFQRTCTKQHWFFFQIIPYWKGLHYRMPFCQIFWTFFRSKKLKKCTLSKYLLFFAIYASKHPFWKAFQRFFTKQIWDFKNFVPESFFQIICSKKQTFSHHKTGGSFTENWYLKGL